MRFLRLEWLALVALAAVEAVASAQSTPAAAAFQGETDKDVTKVNSMPSGMVCGGLSVGVGGGGLTVQTSEPQGGFTGACLMDRPYGGGLPTVCYSPAGATFSSPYSASATVTCSIPAANVHQPDWTLKVDPAAKTVTRQTVPRLRTLETCVPHLGSVDTRCYRSPAYYTAPSDDYPNGDCPCGTTLVSRSCCTQIGAGMVTADGQTATGLAYFSLGSTGGDDASAEGGDQ
jgi:hypothetical protein